MNVINKNSYQPSDKYFSNPSTNYYVVKKNEWKTSTYPLYQRLITPLGRRLKVMITNEEIA